MSDIQVFRNKNFCDINVIVINDELWFVAKDIAAALEYSDTNAMTRHLDEDEVISVKLSGMNMKCTMINESGLYSAILRSRKPEAKQFKKWITSEVIPTIRKTGGYINDENAFIQTYLPYADEVCKIMIRSALTVMKKQSGLIGRQKNLITYKDNVINGLTNEISVADKRQIINRIIKQAAWILIIIVAGACVLFMGPVGIVFAIIVTFLIILPKIKDK